jgi:HEAT repeat protein
MKSPFAAFLLSACLAYAADERQLLDVLRSDASHQDKSSACRELARTGTEQAIPVLVPLLEDEALSDMARFALETIQDPAVDDSLRAVLGKFKGRRLIGVIHSLGVRRHPGSVAALAGLLKDPDPEVARAAVHSLGKFGSAAIPPLEAALGTVAKELRPAVMEGLLKGAESLAPAEASAVYDRLGKINDLPPHLRSAVLGGTVRSRGAEGLPMLAAAIRGETDVPAAAALAIASGIPGAIVTGMLVGEMADAPAATQLLIVRALGHRGDAGAVPTLVSLAKAGEADLRLAAIQSLAQLGDPASLPQLAALTGDPEPTIADAALEALAVFPGDAVDPVVAGLLDGAGPGKMAALIEVVQQRGMGKAVPELLEIATAAAPDVARSSLRALRVLAGPGDIPGVVKALDRPDTAAEAEATLVAISARQPDPSPCSEKLATSLADTQGATRMALLRVLGRNGDATALAAVRRLSKDQDPGVGQAAERILADWPAEPGFVPIFNGRSLSGWNGKPGWWTVHDDALTSESTPEKPCADPNYLMWRGDTPADFELLLEFKISGQANSGIQIRSAELPEWDTFGYQVDMSGDGKLIGFVYHHQYGLVAGRGERVVFAADGKKSVEPIGDAAELLKHYKPDDWNTYHIVCHGPKIMLSLNGKPMCEITDHRVAPAAARGVIALQMHPGPPMKVQFRNIRIKK